MKKNLVLIFFGLLLFTVGQKVLAQTLTPQPSNISPTQIQSGLTTNIIFPIADLGNCVSMSDCKAYCDDPTHLDACVTYAKSHGFYHDSSLNTNQSALLQDAKVTLGCNSITTCEAFCADSTNADACSAFAQKHNLKGGSQSLDSSVLQDAKTTLGCDNAATCETFCQQQSNQDKCISFASSHHLKGGKQKVGPGGCTSSASCKLYCSNPDNFQVCSQFTKEHEGGQTGKQIFTGPGGCTTVDSCRTYCEKNPTICHLPLPTGHTVIPVTGGPTGPLPSMSSEEYCREFPSHCSSLTPSYPTPTRYPTPDYNQYCQSKGCSFNGTTCICPSPTGLNNSGEPTATATPTGAVHGISTQRSFFEWLIDSILHVGN